MAKKQKGVRGRPLPSTGDGKTSGRKPKKSELAMLDQWGSVRQSQPKGWSGFGKLLPFRKPK